MKQIVLIIIAIHICLACNSRKEDIQQDKEVLIKVINSALKLDSNLNNVSSFAYIVSNPTRKRLEAATAHTGGSWSEF
jgi:hypothetical protein